MKYNKICSCEIWFQNKNRILGITRIGEAIWSWSEGGEGLWKHIDMGRQYENGIQRRALSPVPNYSPSSFRFVSLTATELLKYHSIRHSLLLSNYYSISYDRGTTKIVILGQILSLDVNTIIYPPPPQPYPLQASSSWIKSRNVEILKTLKQMLLRIQNSKVRWSLKIYRDIDEFWQFWIKTR